MESPEMGLRPEQEKLNIGKKIAKLIERYASPQDSRKHADIAISIAEAIRIQNKDELIIQLENFGNAMSNEKMEMVEAACSSESRDIISDLNKTEIVSWDELSTSLGVTRRPTQESVSTKKPELSPEDTENAEMFIDTFVLRNDSLTSEAKELLANEARSRRGPWSVKDSVQSINQDGKKITIKTKSSEFFLQIQ